MGFISYLKNKFSKDIVLKQDISMYLVFPYLTKNGRIYMDKKITVPENYKFVLGFRGKVLDSLPTGEHKLGPVILPKSSKKYRLYKPDKKGNPISSFRANAYFVNLNPQTNFEFSTYRRIKYSNVKDGRFSIKPSFEMDFTVVNAEELMNTLLKVYDYLRYGEGKSILRDCCSDYTTGELMKMPYMLSNFTDGKEEVLDVLKIKLSKFLTDFGLTLNDLRIKDLCLSHKAQKIEQKAKQEKMNVWQGLETLQINPKIPEVQNFEIKETEPETAWKGIEIVNKGLDQKKFVDFEENDGFTK